MGKPMSRPHETLAIGGAHVPDATPAANRAVPSEDVAMLRCFDGKNAVVQLWALALIKGKAPAPSKVAKALGFGAVAGVFALGRYFGLL
jgi:hypothetical protein